DLIRVRRPPMERMLAFQPDNLALKRSMRIFQFAIRLILEPMGKPRYEKGKESASQQVHATMEKTSLFETPAPKTLDL
nr:hypothetical protein [Tanacetum cinerariifolium]